MPRLWDKLKLIFRLTKQHALNLGTFAATYKLLLYLQTKLHNNKEQSHDSFIAGLIGGYIVFGDGSPVSQQINLYVLGRVILALGKLAVKKSPAIEKSPVYQKFSAPFFASLCWATVMWLFRWHPDIVQPSMRASMRYLYVKSDYWDNWQSYLLQAGTKGVAP